MVNEKLFDRRPKDNSTSKARFSRGQMDHLRQIEDDLRNLGVETKRYHSTYSDTYLFERAQLVCFYHGGRSSQQKLFTLVGIQRLRMQPRGRSQP